MCSRGRRAEREIAGYVPWRAARRSKPCPGRLYGRVYITVYMKRVSIGMGTALSLVRVVLVTLGMRLMSPSYGQVGHTAQCLRG
jgi:hypothetical protein